MDEVFVRAFKSVARESLMDPALSTGLDAHHRPDGVSFRLGSYQFNCQPISVG